MTRQEAIERAAERDRRVAIVVELMKSAPPEQVKFNMEAVLNRCEFRWNHKRQTNVYTAICGSSACIAGFIVLALSPTIQLPYRFGVVDNARDLLFLQKELEYQLFYPTDGNELTHYMRQFLPPGHSMSSDRETAIQALLWSAQKQAELDLAQAVD